MGERTGDFRTAILDTAFTGKHVPDVMVHGHVTFSDSHEKKQINKKNKHCVKVEKCIYIFESNTWYT